MAIDLRIQKFALDTFLQLERCIGMSYQLHSICEKHKDVSENDSTIEIVELILCRYHFFGCKLMELEEDLHFYKSNDVDFYRYLQEQTIRFFPYTDMNIFDKIVMSCAVVFKMNQLLYLNNMHRDTAPISWAMYFEVEFKEEFDFEGSWISFKMFAKKKATGVILKSTTFMLPPEIFQNDLERVYLLYQDLKGLYCFDNIILTFKQRIKLPIGSSCCPKCLPLFDVLLALSFGRKLITDFQLLEGYLQLFLRMWFANKTAQMLKHVANGIDIKEKNICISAAYIETRTNVNKLFHGRMFISKNTHNPVESRDGHISNSCIFCGKDKEERSAAHLKTIIHRTVSDSEADFSSDSVDVNKKANVKLISDEIEDIKNLKLS